MFVRFAVTATAIATATADAVAHSIVCYYYNLPLRHFTTRSVTAHQLC